MVQFHKLYNLNPNCFYSRKSLICKTTSSVVFVQTKIIIKQTTWLTISHKASIKFNTSVRELFNVYNYFHLLIDYLV